MQPTSTTIRYAGLAVVLTGLSVLVARPLLMFATAGLGAFLLTRQYEAYRAFRAVDDDLTITIDPLQTATIIEDPVRVTITAELRSPVEASVSIRAPIPATATTDDPNAQTVEIAPGDTAATTSVTCSFPIAGQFTCPATEIKITGPENSFREHLTRPSETQVTITPRQPRNIHIGQGREQIAAAYGEHPAGRGESGLIPDEIRPYVAGDSLDRIDWNATARFQSPHVREFEAQTDRTTIMVVDHRGKMATGPRGETMLDYAREVAIGYAQAAEQAGDPLGLYTVGTEGTTEASQPAIGEPSYRQLRDTLYSLEPTMNQYLSTRADTLTPPVESRRLHEALADDESKFATTLAPFFEETETYLERVSDDPLFRTIERLRAEVTGDRWTILFTNDRDRNQLREAVTLARRGDDQVLVFLTPCVLYEPTTLQDTETAYEQYLDFESFRRELGQLDRVTAFEVGPGDRLSALLSARRARA